MKVLSIIAQKGFQDKEYSDSRKAIEDAGIKVEVASPTGQETKGKLDNVVKPDIAIKDANADDYDAVIIIGGPGAPALGDDLKLFKLLNAMNKTDKVIGAICIAPTLLAKAGLLKYKEATVWNGDSMQSAFIEREGARYTGESVTVDGNIVTANGPAAASEFGKAIADKLKEN